jgi:L-ascorbate metabolism protein UlaG (beta-lactamase superfamily)
MAKVTWHGHATCTLQTDSGSRLVIDPFFADNPSFKGALEDVQADYILCTHGHFDHFADCIPLAKRTGATVVSTFEIASFCQQSGVEKVHGMNIGGGFRFPCGYVKMTPAIHSGTVAGDKNGVFTTICGGFLIDLGGKSITPETPPSPATWSCCKGRWTSRCFPSGTTTRWDPKMRPVPSP